ncbi:MAG: DNA repair protein RecO [Deinococcota bacterium]
MRSRYHIREGIILRRKALPSGDVVVTLLSEDGKWRGIAKKGKRIGGHLGKLSLFHDVTVQHYYQNRDDSLVIITQVQLNGALPGLTQPDVYPYAHLLAELTDQLTADVHPGEQMYTYLASALRGLVQHSEPSNVALVMSWKLLGQAGLAPRVSKCGGCGRAAKTPDARVYLDIAAGSLLCDACQQTYKRHGGLWLEPPEYTQLRAILQQTAKATLAEPFVVTPFQWSLLARYLAYHVQPLESLTGILRTQKSIKPSLIKDAPAAPINVIKNNVIQDNVAQDDAPSMSRDEFAADEHVIAKQ